MTSRAETDGKSIAWELKEDKKYRTNFKKVKVH
jgi:hypothetical protein